MKRNPKQLAVCAALLGLLTVGMAVPASAASPFVAPAIANFSWPWETVSVETVETGDYSATMTVGTTQQLSPVILPEKAAQRNAVTYTSDDPNVISVAADGTVQAAAVGTANITATAGGVSCTYTITAEPDSSMIPQELDITLQSSTIYVGDTTSCSLAVLPTTAANYISVTLTSSDPSVATVNNFGKVTGVAPGTATITVTCGDISASAKVRVVAQPSSSSSTVTVQSLTLNTNYVVLKPGASQKITGKVSPSSSSQSLTFKSQDTSVATVSKGGVITAVKTGATSVIVSNGTISASVTVIVNRNASSSGSDSGDTTPEEPGTTDPIVEAIENSDGGEVTYTQAELPVITSDMLNALRLSGATLTVTSDEYSIRIHGSSIKNTAAEVHTALTFTPDEHGLLFTLNEGEALPGTVEILLNGEPASYGRLYLYNTVSEKWQFLNSYQDGMISADTAGDYLLTNTNLRFTTINWTFFAAGGAVLVGCIIAYIVVKKRYWFW